jgi:hypothetical protein
LLRDALALWRGPALADVAYEPFAQAPILRLEELRQAAVEDRIEADLACGGHVELVGELEQLVAEHPLRERLRGQLMLALYRCGRQADALEAYSRARRELVDQVGIEPGAALQELERAILRQDPALAHVRGAPAPGGEERSVRGILVGAPDDPGLAELLRVGEALAAQPPRELLLARLLATPDRLGPVTTQLQERCAELAQRGVTARAAVFTSERSGADLIRLACEQDVDLVLLEAPASLLEAGLPDADLTEVLARAPCDVAVLAGRAERAGGPVLVPFSGAEHDWAAIELGAWIARARGVPLRLLGAGAVPEAGKRDSSRLLAHASLAVHRGLGVLAEPMLVPPGAEAILEASADAGVLAIGLSPRWHQEGLGSTRLALARHARPSVLLVRHGLRPGGLAPRAALTRFTWSVRP